MAGEAGPALQRLVEAYEMAAVVAALKRRLVATRSAYRLSGWVAAARVRPLVTELTRATDGRIAVLSYDPEEVPSIAAGAEKVPVSLDHGYFVGGFERLVLSYGAPLYGTIDPTPFVAGSFILLFGLMFGDVGQGLVLLLLGLAVERSRSGFLSRFRRFGAALTAVGLASMAVGFLDGEFFASEGLLIRPTRWVTGALFGRSVDRVLNLMPERDNLGRLFLFFGFTLGVGALINSIGLIINMLNRCSLKQWDKALFSKTGAAGALFFWYALSFGVRLALGAAPAWFDFLGFGLPLLALIAGPPLWRLGTGHRPVFEAGGLVFAVESFVELLEVMSSYVSNTVSFLRVGAFALSHAVLSFAVFTISDLVAKAPFGGLFAFSVMVVGNVIIILLEGLIVAIQVTRLQYYEFFSKFFTETGVEFRPFRFRREVDR
jgi:V/A-type H+-transporting ATPase subunit I